MHLCSIKFASSTFGVYLEQMIALLKHQQSSGVRIILNLLFMPRNCHF